MANLNQAYLPNISYLNPDIVMLVASDGWDVRALKEARSLSAQGFSVVILGRRRFHTELARFSDEFDIDILNVPTILDAETTRLHLESGVWARMSAYEKILSSMLVSVFSLTGLKIKPKKIPPPIHIDVAAKLLRRERSLALRAQRLRMPRRFIRSSGHNPAVHNFIQSGKRFYRRFRARVFSVLGPGQAGRLTVRSIAGVTAVLLSPLLIAGWILGFLARRGTSVFLKALTYVSGTKSRALAPLRWLAAKWRNFGRNVFRYSRFFLYTIEYGETVARLNPRAIHAHDLYTLQAATRIARWTRSKVVYDAHEFEADRRVDTDARMKHWIIDQEKTYAPRATRCVTVSHAIADEMERNLGVLRPEVIFNAPIASSPPANWGHRSLRDDLGLPRSTPLFVFVGKVYDLYKSNQRVGLIIEAIHLCPGYHLAIVGPMGATAAAEIAEITDRLGLKDRLHIVPPVPAEAIVSYIASADAGIYFMWPETRNIDLTIPNKLFEFSLSGLPLVVTDLTSTRWFCEQAKNAVLVSEKEPEAVAQACRQAYKNARKLKPKKRALEAIRLEFSWEAQGAKLVRFYEALFRESA
jgi:glycosyltransferase involved in cell wall biosynthesis